MGYLTLDGHETEFDDRTLAHLHVVIINKLRNGSSFALSWKDVPGPADSRTSVWVHPGSSIRFQFAGSRSPSLNQRWLQQLAESADSSRGLIVVPEPEPSAPSPDGALPAPETIDRTMNRSTR